MIRLDLVQISARKPSAADLAVLTALHRIFLALSSPPSLSPSASTATLHSSTPSLAAAVDGSALDQATEPCTAQLPSSIAALQIKAPNGGLGRCGVSPDELRDALSGLGHGSAADMSISLGQMHDAAEVLGEVLACLHRAELGADIPADGIATPSSSITHRDLQLPTRVRHYSQCSTVSTPAVAVVSVSAADVESTLSPAVCNYAAAASSRTQQQVAAQLPIPTTLPPVKAVAAAPVAVPTSLPSATTLAHRLFGIDIQMPCAASTPEPSSAEDKNSESSSGSPAHKQVQSRRSSNPLVQTGSNHPTSMNGSTSAPGSASSTITTLAPQPHTTQPSTPSGSTSSASASSSIQLRKATLDPKFVDVLQFTKFFHLVPAQSLRKALAARPSSTFEELLVTVESGGSSNRSTASTPSAVSSSASSDHSAASSNGGGNAAAAAGDLLLRQPDVFALALVWESPQVGMDALRSTLEAVGATVDISLVYQCADSSSVSQQQSSHSLSAAYELRCVVCYCGHHYTAFAFSQELSLWLLFDDEAITLVGNWNAVCRAMMAKRLQPSLLLYERPEVVVSA